MVDCRLRAREWELARNPSTEGYVQLSCDFYTLGNVKRARDVATLAVRCLDTEEYGIRLNGDDITVPFWAACRLPDAVQRLPIQPYIVRCNVQNLERVVGRDIPIQQIELVNESRYRAATIGRGGELRRGEPFYDRSFAAVTAILPELSGVQRLGITNYDITPESAQAIARITNLQRLDVPFGRLNAHSMHALRGLTSLRHLNIQANDIGDEGAYALAHLPDLEYLDISVTSVGFQGLRTLLFLPKLRHLNLAHLGRNSRTPPGNRDARIVGGLSNLEYLDASFWKLGDEGVREFASLSNLKTLRVHGPVRKSRATKEYLQERLPNTEIIF